MGPSAHRRPLALVASLVLSACGGGLYAGPGASGVDSGDDDGDDGDGPPAEGTTGTSGEPPAGCEDACADEGAGQCREGGLSRCDAGPDGCLIWLPPEPCPEGQACGEGACVAAAGFAAEAEAWAVPVGGRAGEGFAAPSGEPSVAGDDAWTLLDLDGDGALDLVRTAFADEYGDELFTRVRGLPLWPFWLVHRGGPGGYGAAEEWPLPVGVGLVGRGLVGVAGDPPEHGDHAWALQDMDGDGAPDLVLTGQRLGALVIPLGPPWAPRWEVHRNTGAGFEAQSSAWSLPKFPGALSLRRLAGAEAGPGGLAWACADLDADGFPDLVLSARFKGAGLESPGFPDSPHWDVHRGGPGGFAAAATAWALPPGGRAGAGFVGGAAGLEGEALAAGDQTWALRDLDGDRRLELVITGGIAEGSAAPAVLSGAAGPAWRVHRGEAQGFALAAEEFAVPAGADARGYHALAGGRDVAGSTDAIFDRRGWELLDLDGDGRLDLVVTNEARIEGGFYHRKPLGDAVPRWDVHFGGDAGFGPAAAWTVPAGGIAGRGFLWGRAPVFPVPQVAGSVLWLTGDLDGDGRPELVVTGAAEPQEASAPWVWRVPGLAEGAPHWRVHRARGE